MEVICSKESQKCIGCSHSTPHFYNFECKCYCSHVDETKCVSIVAHQRKLKLEKLNEKR